MIESPLVALAFLSLFHVLGGAGLGIALRPLRVGDRVNVGLAIWGAMFGGIPLIMSVETPWLLPAQFFLLAVAALLAFFYWDRIRELLGNANVLLILFGGVFFMAGSGAAGMLIEQRDFGMAALFGCLFGGLGLVVLLLGLRRLMAPPSDTE
jgi:hypothetical protein